jgi:hypothetical protein
MSQDTSHCRIFHEPGGRYLIKYSTSEETGLDCQYNFNSMMMIPETIAEEINLEVYLSDRLKHMNERNDIVINSITIVKYEN